MKHNGVVTQTIIRPNQRAWLAGKTLDGGVWLEIEGCPRLTMTPAQAVEMARGIMTCLGYTLEQVPTPQELGN